MPSQGTTSLIHVTHMNESCHTGRRAAARRRTIIRDAHSPAAALINVHIRDSPTRILHPPSPHYTTHTHTYAHTRTRAHNSSPSTLPHSLTSHTPTLPHSLTSHTPALPHSLIHHCTQSRGGIHTQRGTERDKHRRRHTHTHTHARTRTDTPSKLYDFRTKSRRGTARWHHTCFHQHTSVEHVWHTCF